MESLQPIEKVVTWWIHDFVVGFIWN